MTFKLTHLKGQFQLLCEEETAGAQEASPVGQRGGDGHCGPG